MTQDGRTSKHGEACRNPIHFLGRMWNRQWCVCVRLPGLCQACTTCSSKVRLLPANVQDFMSSALPSVDPSQIRLQFSSTDFLLCAGPFPKQSSDVYDIITLPVALHSGFLLLCPNLRPRKLLYWDGCVQHRTLLCSEVPQCQTSNQEPSSYVLVGIFGPCAGVCLLRES